MDPEVAELYESLGPEILRRLERGFRFTPDGGAPRHITLRSAFDREEVLQETFVRFIDQRAKGTFDRSRPARPYVLRIAFYVALRYLRHIALTTPMDALDLDSSLRDEGEAADNRLIDAESRAQVARFEATLEGRDRTLFGLLFREGLSQAEAGAKVGLSRDQVYRVRAALLTRLCAFAAEAEVGHDA